jgi:uncharacterized protein
MAYRLHLAALRNDVETARSLLDAGAEVDTADAHGRTPIMLAARFGAVATLDLLVGRGANLAHRSDLGVTPLRCAVEHGQTEAAAALLQAGANPNETYPGDSEYTPLMKAAFLGDFETTATLVSYQADVNQTAPGNYTALHKASIHANRTILQVLLEAGADIDARDMEGDTPLLWAAWKGQAANALLLLERGADFRLRNRRGETPLSYAKESGDLSLISRLEALIARADGDQNAS